MKHPFTLLTALLLTPLAVLHAADEEAAPAYEQLLPIDVHSHVFEDYSALNDLFLRINMRTVNICVPGGDGHEEAFSLMKLHIVNGLVASHSEFAPPQATKPSLLSQSSSIVKS